MMRFQSSSFHMRREQNDFFKTSPTKNDSPQVVTLQNTINELERKVFMLQSEKNALEQSLKIFEEELVQQKEAEEDLKVKIDSDENQFRQLTQCLADLENKNKEHQLENEELLNLNENLQNQIEEYNLFY